MRARPVEIKHEAGRSTVTVPVGPAAEQHCVLDLGDWERFLTLGYSGNVNGFTAPNGKTYVTVPTTSRPGNHVMLARLILDAKPGERVVYQNGDTLCLCRWNLRLERTKAYGRA